jgi:hypothetical protein
VDPVPIIKTSQERSKSARSCSVENNPKLATGQACGAKLGESKKLVLHNVDPIETETASYPWMTLIFALLSTCKSMGQRSFRTCLAFNGSAPATEWLRAESPERSLGYNPTLESTLACSNVLAFLRIEII